MIPVAGTVEPIIFAHRGGAEEVPENTWTAFQHTRDLGVTHLETDAQLTADGEVVLSHDPTLERTYGQAGQISDYTYSELAKFSAPDGRQMPRLVDVLQEFPDLYLNVDAKSDAVALPLLRVLEQAEAFSRVLVASFSEKRLERIRAFDHPELTTSLGVSAVVRLVLAAQTVSAPETWRVPGPRHRVRAVQVPEKRGPIRVVDRRFIAAAHAAGLAVHVWTVNTAEQMVRLLDLGVDGIVTDRPTMLKEILIARGQWAENS